MLGYKSTIDRMVLTDRFSKINFLIGDFNVTVYNSLPTKGWVKVGSGSASYELENTFVTEKIRIIKENRVVTMSNTIGCDIEKDTFRLFTLDLGMGSMDFFKGSVLNEMLIFNNIESGIKNLYDFGDDYSFKLIYKQLSEFKNELIVGCSKDYGKTWFPFLKNSYQRK